MKTRKAFLICAVISVLVGVLMAFPLFGANSFQEARYKGAGARVVFRVLNDAGSPVAGSKVVVSFDMADRGEGRRVVGIADTNGVCVVEGKTVGVLKIEVSCERHYTTKDEICFIAMGHEHEVKNGKWQPWGLTKQIILLPEKNPVAQIAGVPDWKWTRELNKWVGFDLMKYDFVEPYGVGEVSDMEVMFEWDGAWRQKDYSGMSLRLRFPQKFAGGYYADKTPGSEYCGVYHAHTNSNYKAEFAFSDKVATRDNRGNVTSWDRQFFDTSKVLVVRSRCKSNKDGTLKTVNYFQLSDIQYACDAHGAALRFLSIYNPTPNDTNLEPKR